MNICFVMAEGYEELAPEFLGVRQVAGAWWASRDTVWWAVSALRATTLFRKRASRRWWPACRSSPANTANRPCVRRSFPTHTRRKKRNEIYFTSLLKDMKVLVATEKPFAKKAVEGIRGIVEEAGYELALLEKYADRAELLSAVADVDA